MIITGIVESITEKNGFWGFVVDNVRYGTFKDEPKCKVGDYVSFEADQKGEYWNAKARTIKPAKAPEKAATPLTSTVGAGAGQTKSQWTGDDKRQDSIIYQSSRKDAIELVKILADKDLIDVGKGKKADAIEVVLMYVNRFTTQFVEDAKRLSPTKPSVADTSAEPKAASKSGNPADEEFKDDNLDDLFS